MIFLRENGLNTLGSIKLFDSLALVFVLLTLLVWLAGRLIRRHYKITLQLSPLERRSRLWSRLGTLTLFAAVFGWLLLVVANAVTVARVLVVAGNSFSGSNLSLPSPSPMLQLQSEVELVCGMTGRVAALQGSLDELQELLEEVRDLESNAHGSRLEWIVIVLVAVETVVGLAEFVELLSGGIKI
ncbi:MAG: hypothetical protein WDW38_000008 [Sanguina aurantia]